MIFVTMRQLEKVFRYSSIMLLCLFVFGGMVVSVYAQEPVQSRGEKLLRQIRGLGKKDDPGKSMAMISSLIEIANELGDSRLLSWAWNRTGNYYLQHGEYQIAIDNYNKVLSAKREWEDPELLILTLINLGYCHKKLSNLGIASNYLHEALDVVTIDSFPKEKALTFDLLGNIQTELQNFSISKKYHFGSLKLYEAFEDTSSIAKVYNNLGNTYFKSGGYDSALILLNRAVELKKGTRAQTRLGFSYSLIGQTHLALEQWQESLLYLRKALDAHLLGNDTNDMAYVYCHLSTAYRELGQLDSAWQSVNTGFALAERVGSKDLKAVLLDEKARLFERENRMSEALATIREYIDLKSQILDVQKQRAISELEMQYGLKQAEAELTRQKQEKQLYQSNANYQRLQKIVFLLLAILAVVFAGLSIQRAGKQKGLKEQKLRLLKELQHRVENNLNALSGVLAIQMDHATNDETRQTLEDHRNRISALNLLHNRLFAAGDANNTTEVDFKLFLEDLIQNLVMTSKWHDQLKIDLALEPVSLTMDKAVPLGMMVNELLTNALKYAFDRVEEPLLAMKIENTQGLRVEVIDNGPGLPVGLRPESSETTGMTLLHGLAGEIKARISFEHQGGLKVVINAK